MNGNVLQVLVVEDEALIAMDIESQIDEAGHRVVAECASLFDVEAQPDTINPDLAFVDIQLARNSTGLEVCAHISNRWPKALVIFLTANPAKVPLDYPGAHGIISKPFTRGGLCEAIGYFSEGIFNPPPKAKPPVCFNAFSAIEAAWRSQ